MSDERSHSFETSRPVRLEVRLGRGSLHTSTEDTTTTEVLVSGAHAAEVAVEERDGVVSVVAPHQRGFLERDLQVDVTVVLPAGSELDLRVGSADVRARGRYAGALLRTGSGDLHVDEATGPVHVEAGSGDVRLRAVGDELHVKCGSGDLRVEHAASSVAVSTGSGDVVLGEVLGDLSVKTGSGDLHVAHPHGDVSMTTGSGDVLVDRASASTISLRGASGDTRVAVPPDLAVWTDVTSLSGTVHATTASRGAPADGQPHLTLRVTTVSGDVLLVDA